VGVEITLNILRNVREQVVNCDHDRVHSMVPESFGYPKPLSSTSWKQLSILNLFSGTKAD
jgi:hypothetical protein